MFVLRNDDGEIIGLFANLQPGVAEEYLDVNSEEIAEFYEKIIRNASARNDA